MKSFVCVAFTIYQMFLSMGYFQRIRQINNTIECVLIYQNLTNVTIDKELVKKNCDRFIYQDYKFSNLSKIRGQFYQYRYYGRGFSKTIIGNEVAKLSDDSVIMIFSDQDQLSRRIIEYGKKRGATIVLGDEGLHLYEKKHDVLPKYERIKYWLYGMKFTPYIGYSSEIDVIFANNPLLLKEKIKGKEILHQTVDISSTSFSSSYGTSYTKTNKNKTILFLGQPLVNEGVDEATEIKLYSKLINLTKDYYWIIKPHPRDRIDKYSPLLCEKCVMLDRELMWLPAEIVVNVLKPSNVVSGWSSSTANNKREHNIVYCYKLLGFDKDDVIPKGNTIYVPESEKQFVQAINTAFKVEENNSTIYTSEDIDFIINKLEL